MECTEESVNWKTEKQKLSTLNNREKWAEKNEQTLRNQWDYKKKKI